MSGLGQIPFVSKAILRFRVRSLGRKVDKVKDRMEVLRKDIEAAKQRAANLLVKADYDRAVRELDAKLKAVCEAAREAGAKPAKGKPAKSVRDCAEELGFPKWEKNRTPEQNAEVEECVEESRED